MLLTSILVYLVLAFAGSIGLGKLLKGARIIANDPSWHEEWTR